MASVRGRQWSGIFGRGLVRSCGQITVSVVATLIATQIYSAMRRVEHRAETRPASVTDGGKFDARIAGAELPPLPEPARPVLGIVNWAITPLHPLQPVEDLAWSGFDRETAPTGEPVPVRAPRREVRRVAAASSPAPAAPSAVQAGGAAPQGRATERSSHPDVAVVTAPVADHGPGGLLATASGAVVSVRDFGGSVLAMGVSAVDRILPGHR